MAETFLAPLYQLLLRGGTTNSASVPLYLLVFVAGCAVMALLMLFLDICVFVVRGWSFLRFRHGIRSMVAAVLMPSAAGIVGMIGLVIDILQPSSLHRGWDCLAFPDNCFDRRSGRGALCPRCGR